MPTTSYWESQTFIGRPDIVIVGAGFVGLRTALALRVKEEQLGKEASAIMVIDRHPFGLGASTRNAGFACFGSPTEILADLEQGEEGAVWSTIKRRYQGVERLRKELTGTKHWKPQGGYEVFLEKEPYEQVMDQLPALNRQLSERLGKSAQWLPAEAPKGLRTGLPVLRNTDEAKLHPAALLKNLQDQCRAKDIQLVYGCELKSIDGEKDHIQLETQQLGTVNCQRVLVATNAFSNQLDLHLDLKPQRNLVLLTEPIPGLEMPGTYHHHEGYVYFRTVDSQEGPRVLIGGARHLDEDAETMGFEESVYLRKSLKNYLHGFLQAPIKDIQISHTWMGILAQGSHKTPILKRLSPGLFVAVRLAGMGVALSAEVADTAAELLLEE